MARKGQSMILLASGIIMVLSLMSQLTAAQQCGRQAGNQKCPNDQCCSHWGWCGDTPEFCGRGCQSQCSGGGGESGGSTGQASFYGPPYVPNACYGFDTGLFPANMYIAAAGDGNPNLWDNGRNCGRYFRIQCQGKGCRADRGAITVKIVDRCPNGCSGGRAFDLSKEAFSAIADLDVGVITVSYSVGTSNSAHPDIADDDAVPSRAQQEQLITEVGHIDQ